MIELIHKSLLWIHIPFGFLSLVLFWIPVGLKKGSPNHRKVGRYYYNTMWVVLISSALLCICNIFLGKFIAAMYLGYLTIITAYPLWYSYEILRQNQQWSNRYFTIRKIFLSVLFSAGVGMILLGAIKFHFQGMGTMMVFFGLLVMPAGRDVLMSRTTAMSKETKLKMHIQGTIISGIAAYTAFFAFGGSRILIEVLNMHHQWMMVPWILPTLLGVTYSRYMKRKYRAA
ncbi:MAG: hypothetical protein AAFZ15_28660 [Bacteroidota bacterium]